MPALNATVIAAFSRRMRLCLAAGDVVEARIKGKRLRPVCGDRVAAEPIPGEPEWLITAIGKRDNELTRPNQRGDTEILAANVELLVVVAAALPRPDWFVIDRYVCAAENMRIPAVVVFNKSDLAAPGDEFPDYGRIGYPTVCCSVEAGSGIDELEALMRDRTSIIVGQSGVGKSSIINALLGADRQKTAGISGKTLEGRHTTVNSMTLQLPQGGDVIDSPGVRDYAPALQSATAVAAGFREIAQASQQCRFANCRHLREPGCAVKAAVDAGRISERRYASYKRSINLLAGGPA